MKRGAEPSDPRAEYAKRWHRHYELEEEIRQAQAEMGRAEDALCKQMGPTVDYSIVDPTTNLPMTFFLKTSDAARRMQAIQKIPAEAWMAHDNDGAEERRAEGNAASLKLATDFTGAAYDDEAYRRIEDICDAWSVFVRKRMHCAKFPGFWDLYFGDEASRDAMVGEYRAVFARLAAERGMQRGPPHVSVSVVGIKKALEHGINFLYYPGWKSKILECMETRLAEWIDAKKK